MYFFLGEGRYLLDATRDPAAQAAMQAYADACSVIAPAIAVKLRTELGSDHRSLACAETGWRLFHLAWDVAMDLADYDKRAWGRVGPVMARLRQCPSGGRVDSADWVRGSGVDHG
ncbi:hypothetical protein [Burkholderia pyrrocinia]|uniref:Uncharacterized protein n=1 Tax=Burkholderia pyrrocinia TaxID=60550 RepID=A0ABZ3BN36_BURPY